MHKGSIGRNPNVTKQMKLTNPLIAGDPYSLVSPNSSNIIILTKAVGFLDINFPNCLNKYIFTLNLQNYTPYQHIILPSTLIHLLVYFQLPKSLFPFQP